MIEKLRAHPLFRDTEESALRALADRLEERALAEGEVLFREGEAADAMFVVADGRIAVRKDDQTLAVLRAGELLGEMALFAEEARSADAVALEASTVHRIPYDDLRSFLLEHPTCGARFLFSTSRELSQRLRRTSDYLNTVFETGRIAAAGLGLDAMAPQLLDRLRGDVAGTAVATLLLYNPFGEAWEIAARSGEGGLEVDVATALVERGGTGEVFQASADTAVLGVGLTDDAGGVFGWLLLEKEVDVPFSPQEEVVAAAVGQQTALGILAARARQEEADRRRLERARFEHGRGTP